MVSGASVVATNLETGVKFTTKTQSNGDYLFPQLPVGTYGIQVTAEGFSSFSAKGIVLTIDKEYVEPVTLAVGSTTSTVEVAADPVQVNTTDMQINNVVNALQMEQLPLIGRNFAALELTLPGVQLPDTRFTGNYSISGSQSQQAEYLINGADTNDITLNTISLTPNLDAIDQFNLIDGPLNAEYDRNSGGVVSASIKQGTNRFHGEAFEFYRDTFLNTNNFFQKAFNSNGKLVTSVAKYHQNIFGGTLGGPIFKDKLFFFGAYQGTRQGVPQGIYQSVVLTPAQIGGDFSGDLGGTFSSNPIPATVTIPGCTPGEAWNTCLTSLGGKVPTTDFNPISQGLLKYIPGEQNNAGGFTYNSTSTTTQDQYIGRIDFDPNPKNQIYALGIYQKGKTANGIPFSGATVPGFGDGSISHIQQWTLDYVRQVSNTAVNDLSAHFTRFNFDSGAPQTVAQPSSFGFGISPQDKANATMPSISVSNGGGGFTIGGTTNGPQPRIDQVIQGDDNFTKTFGAHSLKFGYDGRKFSVWNIFDAQNSGSFGFNGTGPYSTGDGYLDFLLGIPDTYGQGTGSIIQADAFLNYVYGQDSWKLTNTFTVNYGLGYSIDSPLENHQHKGEAVVCLVPGEQSTIFPTAPAGIVYPGDPGCSNSGQAYTRYSEFGPRMGFAWAPDLGPISGAPGKFSIRGGFGIYFNRTEEESALQTLSTPPFGFTTAGATDIGGAPSFKNPYSDINGGVGSNGKPLASPPISNPFPYSEPTAGAKVDYSQFLPFKFVSTYDKSFRAPYAENFQLSVEREFPSNVVARVSYVGTLGRHNQVTYEGNPESVAGHAACLSDPGCIADRNSQANDYTNHLTLNDPNIASVGEVGSYSSSNYNSLQVSVTKAETHGLTFQLSYTLARAFDDASSFENSGFGSNGQRGWNQYDKQLNYGPSTFDTRHHFVFSPVYRVPVLHGHSTFSPLNLVASGWEISGILQLTTGQPFDVSYGGSASRSLWCSAYINYYACPDVPDQIAPMVKMNPRVRLANGHSQYFSKTIFQNEAIGTFGNVSRDKFYGPGTNNTNVILAKNFNLSSDGVRYIQLRMESDNVFNHTQFNNPNSAYAESTANSHSTTFGQISSAQPGRQTQLAAKFYF